MQGSLARTHPVIVGAALSVILLCLVAAAAVTGMVPGALSQKRDLPSPRAAGPACAGCGTIVALRQVPAGAATAWRIAVRMDDDSHRALSQPGRPAFAVGERIRIVDGRALPLPAGNP